MTVFCRVRVRRPPYPRRTVPVVADGGFFYVQQERPLDIEYCVTHPDCVRDRFPLQL